MLQMTKNGTLQFLAALYRYRFSSHQGHTVCAEITEIIVIFK
jgi:hypothetical protein